MQLVMTRDVSRADNGGFNVLLKAAAITRMVAAAISPRQHIKIPRGKCHNKENIKIHITYFLEV